MIMMMGMGMELPSFPCKGQPDFFEETMFTQKLNLEGVFFGAKFDFQ